MQLPIVPIDIRPYCRRTGIPARRIADCRPAQCVDRRFVRTTRLFSDSVSCHYFLYIKLEVNLSIFSFNATSSGIFSSRIEIKV